MLNAVVHDEPEITTWVDPEDDEERPLTEDETLQASFFWSLAVTPAGRKPRCHCGLKKPELAPLPDDNVLTQKLAQEHLELGMASKCRVCSPRHLTISEVYSEHGAYLACRLLRNSTGAIRAARRRDAARKKL